MPKPSTHDVDVLIVGGGLAGLSLARQLLLHSPRSILLVDRQALPPSRQKVGEATVQVSGYYYSRVLEMEEHLLREHYLKYNLRFFWPSRAGAEGGDRYEALNQSALRSFSNIATYQLDRNVFEAELLRVNLESPDFQLAAPIGKLAIELTEEPESDEPHRFRFECEGEMVEGRARWVVDASGRGRVLAKQRGLVTRSPIRHGSTFCWVDGLVDVERLTSAGRDEIRNRRQRSELGHAPVFLATNHFCGEGYWFWVIPLHGKTSLGLVYDRESVPRQRVSTPAGMIEWVCEQYPMFQRDLPQRTIVDRGGFADFALDSAQTLSTQRWAMCGEACRFSDPLYSPGGDLISIYNTLITDAIRTTDRAQLAAKVSSYEPLARAVYEAYVPSFAVSYEVLGDQEVFTLRYTWELTIYFAFYVFPFINDLFTERAFLPGFLREFARLGPINRALHGFLVGYYRWKKEWLEPEGGEPRYFDFAEFTHLRAAKACFLKVGLDATEAKQVLAEQRQNIEDLARFFVAHIAHVVTGDARAWSTAFVEGIDLNALAFDPEALRAAVGAVDEGASAAAPYPWRVAPASMEPFERRHRRKSAITEAMVQPVGAPQP